MKKIARICQSLIVIAVFLMPVIANGGENTDKPWEHFAFSLGGFSTAIDSNLVLGLNNVGLGVDVNPEKAFGFDATVFALRADAVWRFTQNRRHRVDFTYIDLRRSAEKVIESDVPIFDQIIEAGTYVESRFDLQIIKLGYSYSFFQDDRFDLGASIGLFIMPIFISVSADEIENEEAAFTAPLPVLGLRFDFALTPKLFIKQEYNLFYIAINDFKGSIANSKIALEYNAWKHVGLGMGVESLTLRIEGAGGNDYPLIDFFGSMDFRYVGLLLYGKVYF